MGAPLDKEHSHKASVPARLGKYCGSAAPRRFLFQERADLSLSFRRSYDLSSWRESDCDKTHNMADMVSTDGALGLLNTLQGLSLQLQKTKN